MKHEELIKKMVKESNYLDFWKFIEAPAFQEFFDILIGRLDNVINDEATNINVHIGSTIEGRIHVGGSFIYDEKPYVLFGEIVWIPKNSLFRGKLGANEKEEPIEAPEDLSTNFNRVSDTAYDLNLDGDIVKLKPNSLVKAFGRPDEADGFKVSGIYLFEGNSNSGYRLHDYEETILYWDEEKYLDVPSPDEFWASDCLYEFRVAGNANPGKFIEWVKTKTNRKSIFQRIFGM